MRVTRREYERAIRIPPDFVGEISNHNAQTYQVWTEARPANDFARLRPLLEKTLDFSRQLADFFPGYEHIIDPLVDFADYGMKASTLSALFADLRKELVPIVQAITSQPPADDSCLRRHYPHAAAAGHLPGDRRPGGLRFPARPPGSDPPPLRDQLSVWAMCASPPGSKRNILANACTA